MSAEQKIGEVIDSFIKKEKKILFSLAINLTVFFLIVWLLDKINVTTVKHYLNFNWLLVIVYLIDFVALIYYLRATQNKGLEKVKNSYKCVFLMLLLLLTVNFYYELSWLRDYHSILIIAIITFGTIAFFQERDILERYEIGRTNELQGEKHRIREFPRKFPRTNSILLLKHITKWMYKEGWLYGVALIAIALIGIGLRVWSAGTITPGRDSFHHIIAAKNIIENGIHYYTRSDFLNYSLAFLFKRFGYSLFIARVPLIIASTISTFIIYQLGKKISKKIGLLSSLLWVTSPWAIGMAHFVREYEIMVMISLFLILNILNYFQKVENHIVTKFKARLFWFSVISIGLTTAFMKLTSSAGIMLLSAVLVLGICSVSWMVTEYFSNHKKMAYSVIVAIMSLTYFFFKEFFWFGKKIIPLPISLVDKGIHFVPYWFNVFFNPLVEFPVQWYSLEAGITWVLPVIIVVSVIALMTNKYYRLYLIVFFSYLLFYSTKLIEQAYFLPRYIYVTLPYFSIILSAGIFITTFIIIGLFSKKIVKIGVLLLMILFFLGIFDLGNTIHGVHENLKEHVDNRQVTENENRDLEPLLALMDLNGFKNDDVVITTIPMEFIWYKNMSMSKGRKIVKVGKSVNPTGDTIYELSEFSTVVVGIDSGWLIAEVWRQINDKPMPQEDFFVEDRMVKFLGVRSYRYAVYKWEVNGSFISSAQHEVHTRIDPLN
ncbi:MAG: hypothetical protein ABIC95_01375 [archaeon]